MPHFDCLLIDGRHCLWRSADAFKQLSIEKDGERIPTGAVFGFLTILTRVSELYARKRAPTIVCWEGGKLKRQAIYPGYKDRSKGDPIPIERLQLLEDIDTQQKMIRSFLSMLGVPQAKAKGWEADDAMGTLAERWKAKGAKVGIFTGDRDLLQCLDENVSVIRPEKGEFVIETPATLKDRLGVTPSGFMWVKALSGDASDCIPGVSGIGPKHAARIVSEVEARGHIRSVDNFVERCVKVKLTERMKQGLTEAIKAGELLTWYDLVTIRKRLKVHFFECNPVSEKKIIHWLMMMKFRSWLQPNRIRSLVSLGCMRKQSDES